MSSTADKVNLLNLSHKGMHDFVAELGEPAYRAKQLIKWVHQQGLTDFNAMSNLSKAFRAKLDQQAEVRALDVAFDSGSADGTHKWLFRLDEGNAIETVFIPEKNRGTLCVSSQVGCALNCDFCSTGKEGFNRNLTLAEIIGQVWMAVRALADRYPDRRFAVTNVVMMGMGEPLLNYEPVIAAMELMMSDDAYGMSKYRVTLSTSGVIPAMLKLRDDSECALAVSLHAPTDALRNELVPLNKKYPLALLMKTCREHFGENSKRVVTFEYVMLDGVNDSLTHAKQLIRLLDNMPCKVNLIPFNPFPKTRYKTSSPDNVAAFAQRLIGAGINTRVRKTRGDDIDAACGQLAGSFKDRTGRHERWLKTGRIIPITAVSE